MKFVILQKAWNEIECLISTETEWGGMVFLATFVVSGRRGSRATGSATVGGRGSSGTVSSVMV